MAFVLTRSIRDSETSIDFVQGPPGSRRERVNTVSRVLLIIMAHHDTINGLASYRKTARKYMCASELGKLSHFHIQKLIFKVQLFVGIPLVILTFYYIMKDRAGEGVGGGFPSLSGRF